MNERPSRCTPSRAGNQPSLLAVQAPISFERMSQFQSQPSRKPPDLPLPSLCPPCTTLQPFIPTLLLIGQPFPTPAFLPTSAVPVHLRSIRRLPPTHHPFFHLGSCQMGAFSFPNHPTRTAQFFVCACILMHGYPFLPLPFRLFFLTSHVLCKQSKSKNCGKRSRAGTLDTAQHGRQ